MENGASTTVIDEAWLLIKRGQIEEALHLLMEPMQQFRNGEHDRGSADLLSLYGFCVGVGHKKRKEGIRLCKSAIGIDAFNPRHHYLLGRIYLAGSSRRKALEAFRKGLSFDPEYRPIRDIMEKLGVRRKPVIPFLPRGNQLNIALGKLRHQLSGQKKKIDDSDSFD